MPDIKKMIWVVLLMFLTGVLLAGCSHLDKKGGVGGTLVGSWKLKNQNEEPAAILTFKKDETFKLDLEGDGIVDLEGTYSIYGSRLQLTEIDANAAIHCSHSGFYDYTIQGKELNFAVFAEECAPRQEILTGIWESTRS